MGTAPLCSSCPALSGKAWEPNRDCAQAGRRPWQSRHLGAGREGRGETPGGASLRPDLPLACRVRHCPGQTPVLASQSLIGDTTALGRSWWGVWGGKPGNICVTAATSADVSDAGPGPAGGPAEL